MTNFLIVCIFLPLCVLKSDDLTFLAITFDNVNKTIRLENIAYEIFNSIIPLFQSHLNNFNNELHSSVIDSISFD